MLEPSWALKIDPFFCYNCGNIEEVLFGGSLGSSTNAKVLCSDERKQLVLSDGKVLGTTLGNVDVITIGIDNGTEMGSLGGSYDGSNNGKLEVLLLGD